MPLPQEMVESLNLMLLLPEDKNQVVEHITEGLLNGIEDSLAAEGQTHITNGIPESFGQDLDFYEA